MKSEKVIRSGQFKEQPAWFSYLNNIWKRTYSLGTRSSLDKESLMNAAVKATGLKDFGDDYWQEPLEVMLTSIQDEANLHPIGQFITRQRIINLLSVRLRAEYYFKKYPEILEQELYPCLVIVGLQRTGTTKLQRLLAADPDNRSLLSWEALNPAPIKGDIDSGVERKKIAKTSVKALQYMSPGFFAIHPIEYDAPEEDVLLLDVSFLSTTTEATMNVPSYAAWLENADQSAAYDYMVKLLKLLQWQRPGKRWVLKTPHHLEFLHLAKKHFKNVNFIWTHRNVNSCIPSFLSMISYSRILFSEKVDQNSVAEHWLKKNMYMLQTAMKYREENGSQSFIDVAYKDLVEDPLAILEQIYKSLGLTIDGELMSIFEQSNQLNPKGKYGQHHYDLEEFGIDEQYLNELTRDYRAYQKKINVFDEQV